MTFRVDDLNGRPLRLDGFRYVSSTYDNRFYIVAALVGSDLIRDRGFGAIISSPNGPPVHCGHHHNNNNYNNNGGVMGCCSVAVMFNTHDGHQVELVGLFVLLTSVYHSYDAHYHSSDYE